MQKKLFVVTIIVLLAIGVQGAVYLSKPAKAADSLDPEIACKKTVDKRPNESFVVKVAFKNKGTTEGEWKIAIAFEGDSWTWKGEQKQLTLEDGERETLTWEGVVPEDALVDSVARLIVYYDNKFVALNWWIHVIPGAELCMVGSEVS